MIYTYKFRYNLYSISILIFISIFPDFPCAPPFEDPRVVVRGGYRCCEHGVFLTEELPGAEAPVDQIEAKFTFEPLGAANQGGQGADGPKRNLGMIGEFGSLLWVYYGFTMVEY